MREHAGSLLFGWPGSGCLWCIFGIRGHCRRGQGGCEGLSVSLEGGGGKRRKVQSIFWARHCAGVCGLLSIYYN